LTHFYNNLVLQLHI